MYFGNARSKQILAAIFEAVISVLSLLSGGNVPMFSFVWLKV